MTSAPDDPASPAGAGLGWPRLHPTTQSAYNRILWNGGLSKSEVAKELGLSRTRMTAIARDLEAAGLIVEGGREQRANTGRPADMLLAKTDLFHFLGVHVRADELVAAVIDLTNKVVWERRQHVAELDPSVIGAQCRTWLTKAKADGLRVAALAVCGSVERIDGATEGFGLQAVAPEATRSEWEKEFGIPVWAEDDIIALTAFEQWPRLAEDQDSMALISLGRDIGFGLVADRKIILGAHGRAGRFSHVQVANDGARCPLGHRGCLWAESFHDLDRERYRRRADTRRRHRPSRTGRADGVRAAGARCARARRGGRAHPESARSRQGDPDGGQPVAPRLPYQGLRRGEYGPCTPCRTHRSSRSRCSTSSNGHARPPGWRCTDASPSTTTEWPPPRQGEGLALKCR
ncbi:hypothetical protein SGRIM119S_07260 [Streptomyces griseorubiginosus]